MFVVVIICLLAHAEVTKNISENLFRVNRTTGDLIAEDLRQCLHHLAEITGGAIDTEEVLGNIFSHFCVGK